MGRHNSLGFRLAKSATFKAFTTNNSGKIKIIRHHMPCPAPRQEGAGRGLGLTNELLAGSNLMRHFVMPAHEAALGFNRSRLRLAGRGEVGERRRKS